MKLNRGRFHRMIWDSITGKPSRDLLPFRTLDEWKFWCAQVREMRWAKARGRYIDLPDFPCRAEIAKQEANESDIINVNVSPTLQHGGRSGEAAMDTERLIRAFQYAARLHAGDLRKGTTIPYLSHLMGVASIVQEHGGDEDQVIAALLHDAIEDHPRDGLTRQQISEQFADRVLALVEACTDADTDPKPPWKERKERYLAHLPEAPPEAMLISLADKVYNARAILADHRRIGAKIWERFVPPKAGTLWYYRSLADTFARVGHHRPLVEELERVVSELERRAGQA